MTQVSMTVRMDSQLKSTFDALCEELGMSANTAMNIFARAEKGETPDLTMEGIDEEIRLARQERRERDERETHLRRNRH